MTERTVLRTGPASGERRATSRSFTPIAARIVAGVRGLADNGEPVRQHVRLRQAEYAALRQGKALRLPGLPEDPSAPGAGGRYFWEFEGGLDGQLEVVDATTGTVLQRATPRDLSIIEYDTSGSVQQVVVVTPDYGLHCRPVGLLCRALDGAESEVWIGAIPSLRHDGCVIADLAASPFWEANAAIMFKSMFHVLINVAPTLGHHGVLCIWAHGPDSGSVIERIISYPEFAEMPWAGPANE